MLLLHLQPALLLNLPLRALPCFTFVQVQSTVRDVAGRTCWIRGFGTGDVAVGISEFAEDGGVGVVEDVEGTGGHAV